MVTQPLPITKVREDKNVSDVLASTLKSTLLVFLLLFPSTFMRMFFHEAGHALFNLTQGVPVHFIYAHPFSFVGFSRPMGDYYNFWQHASGTITELLVFGLIFILLWKHRSFYTLPFLMVFPWICIYDGIGGLFDILGHTGDYYNIMLIMGWPATGFYLISPILIVVGIFFFLSLMPLLGLAPDNRKTLFALPLAMLLYTTVGLPIAYFVVPGSPIDMRYHLAGEIIQSAYYRPIFMSSIGILLSVIYITLFRKVYHRIPHAIKTETINLSWRDFWYPGLLFTVSVILGLIVVL
jgi:hypothetical protein